MHWTYKEQPFPSDLEQGDVLKKTDGLCELLRKYHPYYADHVENLFFIILTQSCDLVRRDGARCASRYISIAPVRSLKTVLNREFDGKLRHIDAGDQPFASLQTKGTIERFLERLFNNNEPSLFYLEQNLTAELASPMCALLSLPITIKSEHYDLCFNARVLSLKDEFQAKLGWLIAQLYSRVGTRDWERKDLKSKVSEAISSAAVWIPDSDIDPLVTLCEKEKTASPSIKIDAKALAKLIRMLPKKKDAAIERILDVAAEAGLINNPSPQRRIFRLALEKDNGFALYFK